MYGHEAGLLEFATETDAAAVNLTLHELIPASRVSSNALAFSKSLFGSEVVEILFEYHYAVHHLSSFASDVAGGVLEPDVWLGDPAERLAELGERVLELESAVWDAAVPYVTQERLWGLSILDLGPRWWRDSDERHAIRAKEAKYIPGSHGR